MRIKNLQGTICLVIFFLFANQALASEWVLYDKSDIGNMYYDKSSIKKVNQNIISVWDKTIYNANGKVKYFSFLKSISKAPANPDILNYQLVLVKIDCVNKKYRISSSSIYNKQNNVVSALPKNLYGEWRGIIPNSVSETLKNKLCIAGKASKIKKK
jgi:hypothetical protein